MATQAEIRAQLGAAFTAWRDTNFPGTPISWQNDDFDPKTANKAVGFVRFTLLFAGGSAASLGNTHFRDVATVVIQTFADLNDGSGRSDTLSESCKRFLQKLPAGAAGIRVIDPGTITIGPDGRWYQVNAQATITADSHV